MTNASANCNTQHATTQYNTHNTQAKNDIIKTVIAVLGTFSAVAFTITRIFAMS